MTWSIVWGPPAKAALFSLPRADAERVSAAVMMFAKTGEGGYQQKRANERILRVGGYRVLVALDLPGRRIWVKMIYRADR